VKRGYAAVLVLAVGCGNLSASDRASAPADGGSDGGPQADAATVPGDAASSACVPRSSPTRFFEANFDGTPAARFSILDIPVDLPPTAPGVSMSIQPPAVTPPNAMLIQSQGDEYALEAPARDVTGGVCQMDASFDLSLLTVGAATTEATIATVGVRNPAFDHCYVSIGIEPNDPRLLVSSHCGKNGTNDFYAYKDVLKPLPALNAYLHFDLHLDLAQATATVTVGATTVTLALGTDQVRVGGTQAYARFGLADGKDLPNTAVALDTLLVDVR
jgi:hypothetical protein